MTKEYADNRRAELINAAERENGELTLNGWITLGLAGAYEMAVASNNDADSIEQALAARIKAIVLLAKRD